MMMLIGMMVVMLQAPTCVTFLPCERPLSPLRQRAVQRCGIAIVSYSLPPSPKKLWASRRAALVGKIAQMCGLPSDADAFAPEAGGVAGLLSVGFDAGEVSDRRGEVLQQPGPAGGCCH